MRYPLSRTTLVPAHRTFHYGRSTIVGHLVMLSVFMCVFGVTSTMAQTGKDARCAAYRGQAHGLCTAAVSEGCFDGVQSPDCDALKANWNERCRVCEGPAPWAVCPCAEQAGGAVSLHERYLALGLEQAAVRCLDVEPGGTATAVVINAVGLVALLRVEAGTFLTSTRCEYKLINAAGGTEEAVLLFGLSPVELEACREDVRSLQAVPGVCP